MSATLEVAWWLNAAINLVSGAVATALIFRNQYLPHLHHAVRRGKLCILGSTILLNTLSILLSATFLLDEGTTLRADAVLSYWARWAWYIPMTIVLFWLVAKWGWHGNFAIAAGTFLAALTSTTALFSVLSISIAHWVWFFLSLVFCGVLAAAVLVFKRRLDTLAWIGLALFAVPAIVRPLIMALGPHLGATLSIEVETWVYTALDCLVFVLYPYFIWYTFCPIPMNLIEHPEIDGYDGYAQCAPKCKKVKLRKGCPPPTYAPPCAGGEPPLPPPPQTYCPPTQTDPCDSGPSFWDRMRGSMYRYRPSDQVSCSGKQCEKPLHPMMPGYEVQQFNQQQALQYAAAGPTGVYGGGGGSGNWDLTGDGGGHPGPL